MLHKRNWILKIFATLKFCLFIALPAAASVVTSVKPIGFIASAIADGVTSVEVLLPDGASEHSYALRPSDVKRLQNADFVVWVGSAMESFLTPFASALPSRKNLELADLTEIKPLLIRDHHEDETLNTSFSGNKEVRHKHHHHGEYNMHLWLSPRIAWQSAVAIHRKLLEIMPQNKKKLDANLHAFEVNLAKVDQQINAELSSVKKKRYFVFHNAYTYFEKHYGLTPAGYFTVNPEIQPGAQRLHQIRTQLVQHKAVCVFAEPQFRPAVIDAVSRGTSVRKGTLDPLGIKLGLQKDSYMKLLSQLSNQYESCLKGA